MAGTNFRRRRVVAALAALPLGFVVGNGRAQEFAANKEYILVSPPLPPESPNKIEVIEFFSYACPYCYSFEPAIEAWIDNLPPYVMFHRIPVVYHEPWYAPARLYYALEILRENKRLDRLIFDTMHKEHRDLTKEDLIATFLETQGIPQKKFSEAFNSFTVETKMQRGRELTRAYKNDQVPELGVDGRYLASSSMTESQTPGSVLPVVDYLVELTRKERKLARA
jgi:thiol:disulfide interchange protein DsbA